MTRYLWILFGPSTWGAGGNMVAWVICGVIGFGWLHSKEKARHLQKMAQAKLHHQALLDQAKAQHEDMKRHVAAHCSDLKEHVSVVAAPPAAAARPAARRTT
jgi:hypothetical protein